MTIQTKSACHSLHSRMSRPSTRSRVAKRRGVSRREVMKMQDNPADDNTVETVGTETPSEDSDVKTKKNFMERLIDGIDRGIFGYESPEENDDDGETATYTLDDGTYTAIDTLDGSTVFDTVDGSTVLDGTQVTDGGTYLSALDTVNESTVGSRTEDEDNSVTGAPLPNYPRFNAPKTTACCGLSESFCFASEPKESRKPAMRSTKRSGGNRPTSGGTKASDGSGTVDTGTIDSWSQARTRRTAGQAPENLPPTSAESMSGAAPPGSLAGSAAGSRGMSTLSGSVGQSVRVSEGEGTFKCPKTGVEYKGTFKKGTMDGWGTCVYSSGSVYEGEWKTGKRHGLGMFRFVNGDVYQGSFKEGKRDGLGSYVYSDGGMYQGHFSNNLREGKGRYRFTNGDSYEGEYRNDMRDGKGTYRSANGNIYKGLWENDQRQGAGKFKWADGAVFEGTWSNNVKHGIGIYRTSDGKKFEERWKNGLLIYRVESHT